MATGGCLKLAPLYNIAKADIVIVCCVRAVGCAECGLEVLVLQLMPGSIIHGSVHSHSSTTVREVLSSVCVFCAVCV